MLVASCYAAQGSAHPEALEADLQHVGRCLHARALVRCHIRLAPVALVPAGVGEASAGGSSARRLSAQPNPTTHIQHLPPGHLPSRHCSPEPRQVGLASNPCQNKAAVQPTHRLAPSRRSTAAKLRSAPSSEAARGDTSSVRLVQHSYVRLTWPQAAHSTAVRV